jgi:hypothetical protein
VQPALQLVLSYCNYRMIYSSTLLTINFLRVHKFIYDSNNY